MSFRWISAGTPYSNFAGCMAYIKYKPRRGEYSEELFPTGILARLTDREVFLQRPGMKDYNCPQFHSSWESAQALDIWTRKGISHDGLMLCYSYEHKESKRDYRYSIPPYLVMADSGGFQLLTGALEFVDPKDVMLWGNQFTNNSMCLDIPITEKLDKEMIAELARIQNLNTEVMLSVKRPTNTLWNIVHGLTYEDRMQYLKTVDRPELNNIAIGGLYLGEGMLMDLMYNIMSVTTQREARRYHVFGIADTKVVPLLAWLGRYWNITSDSSTPMQAGTRSEMMLMRGAKLFRVGVGYSNNELLQSEDMFMPSPCSCGVCSALGSPEFYAYNGLGGLSHWLLTLHNVNTMAAYTRIWNNLAQTKTLEEYKEFIKLAVDNSANLYRCLDYIESVQSQGFAKASDKIHGHRALFNKSSKDRVDIWGKSGVLFSGCREEEPESASGLTYAQRAQALIEAYDRYHAGLHTVGSIRAKRAEAKTQLMSQSGIKGEAGKKKAVKRKDAVTKRRVKERRLETKEQKRKLYGHNKKDKSSLATAGKTKISEQASSTKDTKAGVEV